MTRHSPCLERGVGRFYLHLLCVIRDRNLIKSVPYTARPPHTFPFPAITSTPLQFETKLYRIITMACLGWKLPGQEAAAACIYEFFMKTAAGVVLALPVNLLHTSLRQIVSNALTKGLP